MGAEENSKPEEPEVQVLTLVDFLESMPPNQAIAISDIATREYRAGYSAEVMGIPEIQLHCSNDVCNGTRFFRCITTAPDLSLSWKFFYLTYKCSNCQKTDKVFALAAKTDQSKLSGHCYKFGELPPFGPPTPARLISLIGPDRELFLRGRRCENQGLGIGAFVYYRRVVENQKDRILREIIKVATQLGAPKESIAELESALKETQFSKALSSVKKGIPQSLLINGHNPLSLLHGALSEGVHDKTDEACLEIASSVRVILIELSERLAQALKDEAELNHALKTLLADKSKGTG
ncbi:MAG: hypothetical protein EPN22_14080 [Nitrospirae bacterium]|nr:MAG: hypothetical protein EPN22_14080 [Nitrospirota bacterium]